MPGDAGTGTTSFAVVWLAAPSLSYGISKG